MSAGFAMALRCLLALPLLASAQLALASATAADCALLARAQRFDPALDDCFALAIRAGGEGMERLLARDFSYNTSRGTRLDGEQLRAWLAGDANRLADVRVEEVRERATGTAVLTDGVMVATPVGEPPLRSRYLHVWVHEEPAGWRLLARQVTELPADAPSADASDPLHGAFTEFLRSLVDAERNVRGSPAYGSDTERAAGYLHLSRMVLKAVEQEMVQDVDFPFFRVMDLHIREGGDNPDQRYLFAPVRGGQAYRIHGQLGSADRLEVQLYAGEPWAGSGRSAGYLGFEQIDIGAGGEFSIELVAPDASPGRNRLGNPGDSTTVVVRQIYSRWQVADPGHVHIDRVGFEGLPRAPASSEEVGRRLRETARVLAQSVQVWPDFVQQRYVRALPANTLTAPADTARLGGVHGRWMASGHFEIPAGQALVVRTVPTSAHYQALQLADLWFASLEYANGTASFTAAQSRLAADGAYYHVISAEDPGYHNWLGTGGLQRGVLLLRYDGVRGELPANQWPSAQLLPLAELERHIPGFTMVTPEERARQLRARRAHVQRRFSR